MPTSPSSNDVTRPYCTTADLAPWILPHVIGGGASNPLTSAVVNDMIVQESRLLDGKAAGMGIRTPFPACTASDPSTPVPIKLITQYRTAAKIAMIGARSSAQTPDVQSLLALANDAEAQLENDALIQFVSQEPLALGTLQGTEWGWLGNTPGYRLRNPGLIIDATHPLKFLDSNGKEITDTAGIPYGPRRLWSVADASQSVINVWDYTRVQSIASYVSYWFTWRDTNAFGTEPAFLTGVATYGG